MGRLSMAQLNAAQKRAVEHGDGPLLILAGAGSGKTRVVTQRIASLVRGGTAPERILAVSFTNKAAEEMGERMVPLIGRSAAAKLWLSTFHSFGLRFLREEHRALRLGKRFVIFDQGDSLALVRDILRELRESGAARRLDPMAILARISTWKSALVAPEQVPESDFEYDDVGRDVFPEYEARKRAMQAVDFDDLCVLPVRLLQQSEDARERWSERFDHLLVDEFQDTSAVQLELVRLMQNRRGNVCVVGDDDQSIYAFRGAVVGNIIDFDKHFAGTSIVKLEDNYRSRAAVLEVANAAIAQSAGARHGKTLRAARGPGDRVRLCECEDPAAEAKLVALEILDLHKEGRPRAEMAVLYRSNLQARLIEEELRAQGVPYRLFGGTQFFDRKEVKDVAAYLRVLINPRDEVSLRRILNYPPRGIGAKTVERIDARAQQLEQPFPKVLQRAVEVEGVPDNSLRSIDAFLTMLDRYRERMSSGQSLAALARELVAEVGVRQDLEAAADGKEQGTLRWGNIEHMIGWLDRFEREAPRERRELGAFLERVTLRGDPADDQQPGDQVVLSSLHASKGLEFDVVFLIGCVEGQLPHSRTLDPKVTEAVVTDVDEERRLFYVGVTRARERLYLCRPRRKLVRGKPTELAPSRFLEGLPEEHLEPYERPEGKELDFDEIAELGRAFLDRARSRVAE
ncbi:MAG: UvrD-helicase domain-containing protein [Myxococcales bacterium]|nr:UvrD-helicase domain-containing protein [Myxococcales bacterium]